MLSNAFVLWLKKKKTAVNVNLNASVRCIESANNSYVYFYKNFWIKSDHDIKQNDSSFQEFFKKSYLMS